MEKKKQNDSQDGPDTIEIDIQQSTVAAGHKGLMQLIKTTVQNGYPDGQQEGFFKRDMISGGGSDP